MKNRYSAIILITLLLAMVPLVVYAIPPYPHSTGNSYGCSVCHNSQSNGGLGANGYNNICISCHNPNDPKGSAFPFTQADVASLGGNVLSRYSAGIAPTKVYQTSHGWTGTSVNQKVASLNAITGNLNSPNISGQLLCATCHDVHSAKSGYKDVLKTIPIAPSEPGYGKFLRALPDDMCRDCHRSRDNMSSELGSHPINISISSAKIRANPAKFQVDGNGFLSPINSNPANPSAAMSISNGKILCTSCHGVHYTDSNSATFDSPSSSHYRNLSTSTGTLLKTSMFGSSSTDRNICTNCHKPTSHSTMGNAQCADCHSGHVEYDPKAVTPAEKTPNAFVLRRYVNMSSGVVLAPTIPGKLGEVTAYRQKVVYLPLSSPSLTVSPTIQMIGTCIICHLKPAASPEVKEHGSGDLSTCSANGCHTPAQPVPPMSNLVCGGCHGMPPLRNIWGTYSTTSSGYAVYSSTRRPNKSRTAVTLSYKDSTAAALFKSEYSSAHKRHSNGQNLGDPNNYGFSCAECHYDTSLSSRYMQQNHKEQTYVDVFLQVSSTIGITSPQSASGAGRPKYVRTGAGSCSAVYCHSNGNPRYQTQSRYSAYTVKWSGLKPGVKNLGCNSCHRFGDKLTTNAHSKHVNSATYALKCATCHENTVLFTNSTSIKLTKSGDKTTTTHVNGTKDIIFNAGTPGSNTVWTQTTAECKSSYCHSNGAGTSATIPSWTSPLNAICTGCHGGNATSGNAINTYSHAKHVNNGGRNFNCGKCHGKTVGLTNDRLITNYSKHVNAATFGDYSAPGYGKASCSTSYCHSNGASTDGLKYTNPEPIWRTGTLACNGCHGNDLVNGAQPLGMPNYTNQSTPSRGRFNGHYVGSHGVSNATLCVNCHARTVTASGTAILGTYSTHVNSRRDVVFGGTVTTGTYDSITKRCSNVSCHTGQTVRWGGSIGGASDCTSCHGGDNLSSNPIATNNHTKHLNVQPATAYGYGCAYCHVKTVNSISDNRTKNDTSHNKVGAPRATVSMYRFGFSTFSGLYSPGATATGSSCSTTYCHGGSANTPTWGGASLSCNGCHAAANSGAWAAASAHKIHLEGSQIPTNYTNLSGNVSTGSQYRFSCSACHEMASGKAVHANGPRSAVRAADIYFGFTSAGVRGTYTEGALGGTNGSFKWSSTSSTGCTTTYCHSNGRTVASGGWAAGTGAVVWATTASTSCTICHAGASNSSLLSGKHQGHLDVAFNTTFGSAYVCVDCHANTVSSNNVIGNKSNHVDKFRDFSGARAYKTGFSPSNCTTYCHSAGKPGVAGVNNQTNPSWTASAYTDCKQCHGGTGGAFTSTAGEPNYATGGAGKENSHQKHVAVGAADCVSCHQRTVTTAGTAIIAGSAKHTDKVIDVNMNRKNSFTNFSGIYTPAGKTCASTYCHGSGTPAWGGATLACDACHAAAKAGYWNGNSAHMLHIENSSLPKNFTNTSGNVSTASQYRFSCSACHEMGAGKGAHSNAPQSAYRAADVFFGFTTAGVRPTYTQANAVSGTDGTLNWSAGNNPANGCNATYCHSNGQAAMANGLQVVYWSTSVNAGTCLTCHGGASNSSLLSGKHQAHLDTSANPTIGTALACIDCHAKTVSSNTAISNKTKHVNKFREYSGVRAGQAGTFAGQATCGNLYCHSNGKTNALVFINMTGSKRWTAGGSLGCNGCHGRSLPADFTSTTGAPNYINASTSLRNQFNSHKAHVVTKGFSCYVCHTRTVTTAGTAIFTGATTHINKRREVGFDTSAGAAGPTAAYNATAMSCSSLSNTNCHAGSFRWGGTGGCSTCHPFNNIATGNHTKHLVSLVCADCHAKTVDNAASLLAVTSHKLLAPRGFVAMNTGTYTNFSGVYNPTTNVCSATYCHGSGTPTWTATATALACNACHAAANTGYWAGNSAHKLHIENSALPINFTNLSGNVSTGSQYRFSCSACHEMGATKSIHSNGPRTAYRAADVFFGYTAAGVRGTYAQNNSASGTDGSLNWTSGLSGCNNTYCHSNGRPAVSGWAAGSAVSWSSSTASIGCTACHGGARGSSTPIATGAHRAHMNNITTLGATLTTVFTCNACHANTVSDNSTIGNKKIHVNKLINYSGVKAGRIGTFAGQATCGNLYCHSNGNPGALVYINMTGSKRWTAGGTLGCNGCHGRSSNVGAPDYANTGGNYNSHPLHISKLGTGSTTVCAICHRKSVDKTIGSRLNAMSSAHLNGSANVWMNSQAGVSASFNANVCSNVICHSNNNVTWGQTTNCGFCHAINKLSRGHIFHVYTSAMPVMYNYTANNSTGTRYNYGCAVCHPVANGSHMSGGSAYFNFSPNESNAGTLKKKNPASIANTNVQVGAASSGTIGTAGANVRCINLYCHSNGMAGISFKAYTTPEWYAGVFTGDRCANCHGNSPNSTRADNRYMPGSPSHYNTNWLGSGKTGGHLMAIHANKTVNSSNFNGIMQPGTTNPSVHGTTAATTTTINCDTCHYTVVTSSANDKNVFCASCHPSTAPAKGDAFIANKTKHVNGDVTVSYRTSVIVTKAQLKDNSFSNNSSATLWQRVNGYKASTSYDRSKQTLATGATAYSAGNCANVVCHFNNTVNWSVPAGTFTCANCHTKM